MHLSSGIVTSHILCSVPSNFPEAMSGGHNRQIHTQCSTCLQTRTVSKEGCIGPIPEFCQHVRKRIQAVPDVAEVCIAAIPLPRKMITSGSSSRQCHAVGSAHCQQVPSWNWFSASCRCALCIFWCNNFPLSGLCCSNGISQRRKPEEPAIAKKIAGGDGS
jgi:hypothetical protein